MIYFGLAICIRSKNAVVQQPELSSQRIEVYTVDHTNAPDDSMCIATPLRANQFYVAAVHLGKHRIIKEQVPLGTGNKSMPDGFPHIPRTDSSMSQKILNIIMVERVQVICQISTGIIDLTAQHKLTIYLHIHSHTCSPEIFKPTLRKS